jgi:hypothetical protein
MAKTMLLLTGWQHRRFDHCNACIGSDQFGPRVCIIVCFAKLSLTRD